MDIYIKNDLDFDEAKAYNTVVLVIGAGGAGLTSSVVASDLGKDVMVLESEDRIGGNSIY